MQYKPDFRLTANGKDITAQIKPFFSGLKIVDKSGVESDSLTLTLVNDDHDKELPLPPSEAELEVFLGYENELRHMGLFFISDRELSFFPDVVTIRATGASFSDGNHGALHGKKRRSFENTTVGDIARKVAAEGNLQLTVAAELDTVPVEHIVQQDESNINLLTRLLNQHDATFKINGGTIAIAPKGKGKTASGKTIPVVQISRTDLTPGSGSAKFPERKKYNSVIATWRDVDKAKDVEEVAGKGEPAHRLKNTYQNKSSAQKAARSVWQKLKRDEGTFSFSVPGNVNLVAESHVSISGLHSSVNRTWAVTEVTHTLKKNFVTSVSAELAN